MKKFLKNYWLIIFLAFIASLLIGIFFIKRESGTEKDTEKLLPIPKPRFQEYQIKTTLNYSNLLKNFPEIPQSESVYEVGSPSFLDQEAIKIAEKFNLKEKPNFKDFENKIYYEWIRPEKDLIINLTEGNLDFIRKDLKLNNFSLISLPDISEVNSITQLFLEEKGLLPSKDIELSIKDKSYLQSFGLEYGVTNNPQEAFAIEVSLQYKLNNIRFLENDVVILIGDKNEVLKLEYQSMFKNLQSFDTYPLKNKSEIIESLKSIKSINYFKIINDYALPMESENIKSIDLNKIELVYLKNTAPQSYLQPIFFISGQGILSGNKIAEVGIYLPAIKDEYLLK